MKIHNKADHNLILLLLAASAKVQRSLDGSLSAIKGITFSEYQLLTALANQHNSTATRVGLANAVGHTPSGVTRALKPLEKIGYVTTSKDARDARRSLATLTSQGVELLSDATGVVHDVIADLAGLARLSPLERDRFANSLSQLTT